MRFPICTLVSPGASGGALSLPTSVASTTRRLGSSTRRLVSRQRFQSLSVLSSNPTSYANPGRTRGNLVCGIPLQHQAKFRGAASFSSSARKENRDNGGSHHIRSYKSHYINGKWTPSSETRTIDVIDPSNGRVVATVPSGTMEDTLKAIEAAKQAKDGWGRETTPRERLDHIRLFLEAYRSDHRLDEIVDRLSVELGCTRAFANDVQAMNPAHHTQTLLDLLDPDESAGAPPAFAWEEAAGRSTVVREAVGVVGAITPWNYPLNQIALKVIPALVAGCTVVLKPSEVTPLVAYSFAEALEEAGLPDGVFNMVMGTGPECGRVLAEDPRVDVVSFTGSTNTGRVLAEAMSGTAKALRTELGGKSAAVLLDDADLPRVVPEFVKQLTRNTGQSCNALSRILVPREHQDEVLDIARRTMLGEVVGPSSTEGSTLGPLVSEVQYDRVRSYISRGISEGATLVTGGLERPKGTEDSAGYFVAPTLFGNVEGTMTIAQEEIFGPVLCVIPYDTEDEAIAVANGTPYGLNSAVASRDTKRALDVAARLDAGMVMVNKTSRDFEAPVGGYKHSGNAREWGLAGLDEYLITKTVNIPLEEYRAIVYDDKDKEEMSSVQCA